MSEDHYLRVDGWKARLRVLLTGRVQRVRAPVAPVLCRRNPHGYSLDTTTLAMTPEEHYGPRPGIDVDWPEPEDDRA